MRILEITPLKSHGRQEPPYKLIFDTGEECVLEGETLLKYKIHANDTINESAYRQIISYDQQSKMIKKSIQLILLRPRSAEELKIRFRKAGLAADDIQAAVDYLRNSGYIDDAGFAIRYAKALFKKKPVGRLFIERELLKKGISRIIAEQAIASIQLDELAQARLAVQKKLKTLRITDKRKIKEKLYAFLAQRGFSRDIIRKVTGSDDSGE